MKIPVFHLLPILLVCSLAGRAQEAGQEKESRSLSKGNLILGYASFNTTGLESFVPGAERFDPDFFLFGLRSLQQWNRLVVAYDFYGAFGGEVARDSLRASVGGGILSLGAGYVVAERNSWQLYPMVNAGVAYNGIELHEDGELSLAQVQGDPGREINLFRLGFVLDFSLHFDLTPAWKYREKSGEYVGPVAGLSLGYLMDFANNNWRYAGGRIQDAPTYGMQGPYLRLTLGAAGTNRLVSQGE